jgi:SET domain-containing protein|tara:strand:- start:1747 stop:2277 length:531 start_codon:yes stop_codon:yes gene_type:complete
MGNESYEVRGSSIHERGLFATKSLKAGARVVQYVGEKISKKEASERALEWEHKAKKSGEGLVYIFELDDQWDIDGRIGENPARYINHSCDGNCEAINDAGEIWIIAERSIKKGEELTYDYGYDMEHFLDHPCLCGTSQCVGFIVREDQRLKVRRLLKNKKINKPQSTNQFKSQSKI